MGYVITLNTYVSDNFQMSCYYITILIVMLLITFKCFKG